MPQFSPMRLLPKLSSRFKIKHGLLKLTALIPLIAILTYATPVVQRPESICDAETFMTSSRPRVALHPEKVIVEPWNGQHNVYAIFMLPNSLHPGDRVLLMVKNVGVFCDPASRHGTQLQGVVAKPDHYLMMDYIHTRTSLWLILQGKFDELKQPANWVLIFHQ